jgi:hypothetical protein
VRSTNFESKLKQSSLENVYRNPIAADNMAHKTDIVQPETSVGKYENDLEETIAFER